MRKSQKAGEKLPGEGSRLGKGPEEGGAQCAQVLERTPVYLPTHTHAHAHTPSISPYPLDTAGSPGIQ